jgi:diguanylate cyclase (GGDEF)-like protein
MSSQNQTLDPLTGFLIRKTFEEQFKAILEAALAGETAFSIAFADIDFFKDINDQYGHATGDKVLTSLADTFRAILGDRAILGRYGGDEFALLFPAMEREQAFLLLEQLRQSMESLKIPVEGEDNLFIQVKICAGLASFPVDGQSENELIRKADQALYRAKEGGRNRVRLAYEEKMVPKTTHFTLTQLERLSRLAQERNRVEADLLREALDDLLIKYKVSEILTPRRIIR